MVSGTVHPQLSAIHPPSSSAESGVELEDFLGHLDRKLGRRNERLLRKLLAWGNLLDVAGWSVAMDLAEEGLWMSQNAEQDLMTTGAIPTTWPDLISRISPETLHRNEAGLLIWSRNSARPAELETQPHLTRRESEVMSWLREGKTGPEIAIILGCATRTVEKHLANLYRKLGVQNRAAVILKVPHPIP